jgi:uncharacterized membrane protein
MSSAAAVSTKTRIPESVVVIKEVVTPETVAALDNVVDSKEKKNPSIDSTDNNNPTVENTTTNSTDQDNNKKKKKDAIIELSSTERLVIFSDAVIAISLTLLILPLLEAVRTAQEEGLGGYEYFKTNVGPMASFGLSFYLIINYWRLHQLLFQHKKKYTEHIRALNGLFLFLIVTLPVTNASATELAEGMSTVAHAVYLGNLMLLHIVLAIMNILARNDPRMWDSDHNRPPTAYGLLYLAISFVTLTIILILVCTTYRPQLLYILFSFILIKPLLQYLDDCADVIDRFGDFIDHCLGLYVIESLLFPVYSISISCSLFKYNP